MKTQKSGAYVPGVRPGKGQKSLCLVTMSFSKRRISIPCFITIIPILARDLFGLTDAVALGGTSLLIIISTGIEGMKQLEGYLLKRGHVGFRTQQQNRIRLDFVSFILFLNGNRNCPASI